MSIGGLLFVLVGGLLFVLVVEHLEAALYCIGH